MNLPLSTMFLRDIVFVTVLVNHLELYYIKPQCQVFNEVSRTVPELPRAMVFHSLIYCRDAGYKFQKD